MIVVYISKAGEMLHEKGGFFTVVFCVMKLI